MSCVAPISIPPSSPSGPRKRTSSFSSPKPHKAARMGGLRRTASYITLPDIQQTTPPQSNSLPLGPSSGADCSAMVQRHYKDQRRRRKAPAQFTIGPPPSPAPPPPPKTNTVAMPCPRASSPLAPSRKLLPPRASFPRSKHEPDLYKIAITTRMRCSPEGQKILLMGPRLAVSILTATRELEKIVASQIDGDNDVTMFDGTMGKPWLVAPVEDWEMVDCTA